MRRSVEGRGMGRGTRGKQYGHYMDFQVLTLQGLSGRKAGNLKVVGLGWISWGRKIVVLDGGRYEMVVSSCFEDLEGRVGLKRVWDFVPKAGKSEMKE